MLFGCCEGLGSRGRAADRPGQAGSADERQALVLLGGRCPVLARRGARCGVVQCSPPVCASPSCRRWARSPAGAEPPLPAWMVGAGGTEQTLTSFTTPLGVEFIGAPGRPLGGRGQRGATRTQVGKPVALELRYDAVEGGAGGPSTQRAGTMSMPTPTPTPYLPLPLAQRAGSLGCVRRARGHQACAAVRGGGRRLAGAGVHPGRVQRDRARLWLRLRLRLRVRPDPNPNPNPHPNPTVAPTLSLSLSLTGRVRGRS